MYNDDSVEVMMIIMMMMIVIVIYHNDDDDDDDEDDDDSDDDNDDDVVDVDEDVLTQVADICMSYNLYNNMCLFIHSSYTLITKYSISIN